MERIAKCKDLKVIYGIPYVDIHFDKDALVGITLSPTLKPDDERDKILDMTKSNGYTGVTENSVFVSGIPVRFQEIYWIVYRPLLYLNNYKRKEVIIMPRTKGSKNRPKTNTTKDYASQIAEKQETIASLNPEIAFIQKTIEEQKNTLKEQKTALKKAEKEVATLEAKKAKADAKATEEAKKAEAESVVKKLLASGMSADEILEKLK